MAASPRFPARGRPFSISSSSRNSAEGAFGRVYLAEQSDLADRPVALKVTPPEGEEPRNLARLQHTHIVPIHSVHLDSATGFQLICMPYVGGANLAEVLETAGATLPSQVTGQSLMEALDRVARGLSERAPHAPSTRQPAAVSSVAPAGHSPSTTRSLWGRYLARLPWWAELEEREAQRVGNPSRGEGNEPARRYLRCATYVQASVYIAARLAEALDHAHSRGILHRDLKPSNILIAADGTPMLLDFNLATELVPDGDASRARAALGGTLPYMAPEHLDAFDPAGQTPAEAVGPAADLYGLGLILFEMVAGALPFDDPGPSTPLSLRIRQMIQQRTAGVPSIRAANPQASWGLESVLRRCLEPDPARRYQSASELADDLQRLLDDRPLHFARELSLKESVGKWCRRHPRISSTSVVGSIAVVLLLMAGATAAMLASYLNQSNAQLQFNAFQSTFRQCQLRLNTTSGPIAHLNDGVRLADQAMALYGLTEPVGWNPPPAVSRLSHNQQLKLREQLSELIQLRAHAQVSLAEQSGSTKTLLDTLADAVIWLDEAESIDPDPPETLYADRAFFRQGLGDSSGAQADLARRDRPPAHVATTRCGAPRPWPPSPCVSTPPSATCGSPQGSTPRITGPTSRWDSAFRAATVRRGRRRVLDVHRPRTRVRLGLSQSRPLAGRSGTTRSRRPGLRSGDRSQPAIRRGLLESGPRQARTQRAEEARSPTSTTSSP